MLLFQSFNFKMYYEYVYNIKKLLVHRLWVISLGVLVLIFFKIIGLLILNDLTFFGLIHNLIFKLKNYIYTI